MEFVDRVSAYPNRYLMTDENGHASYVVLEKADEPTTVGTPLNAETFNGMLASRKCYGSLADIGITELPTTMGVIAEKMPINSVVIFSTSDNGAAISDWGLMDSTGTAHIYGVAYILKGDSKYRVSMLFVESHSALADTTSFRTYSGVYIAATDTVKWVNLSNYESTASPGCYFRMVDGEREWINPPMMLGTEYRTTERHNGKVVYVTSKDCKLPIQETANLKDISYLGATQIIRANGCTNVLRPYVGGFALPYRGIDFEVDTTTIKTYCGSWSNSTGYYPNDLTATITIWYTKD
jgi:hypothetical protein